MATDDVKDATLALKGILGISNQKSKTSPELSAKKNAKKKKVKDGKNTTSGNGGNQGNSNSNKNSKKKKSKNGDSQSQKARGKKKVHDGLSSKGEQKNSNFAWSAFQSPPDASNLPLPAFGSDPFDTDHRGESNSGKSNDLRDQGGEAIQIAEGEAERMANVSVSRPIASEDDIKALLNITGNTNPSPSSRHGTDRVERVKEESNTTGRKSEDMEENVSGVNLAALALNNQTDPTDGHNETKMSTPKIKSHSKAQPQPTQKQPEEQMDPLTNLMNPSYGRNVNNSPMSPYQNSLAPHHHHPYGMQSPNAPPHPPNAYPLHPHAMMHQPYITLQVQVPSALLPGRQMMVPTSPGYNVPVVVPEGVQPGMVIPVTIPNPAYGQNPMMQHAMGYGPNNGHYVQQQPYVHQQQFNSHPVQKTQSNPVSNKPAPGSWAAKAAVQPSDEKK